MAFFSTFYIDKAIKIMIKTDVKDETNLYACWIEYDADGEKAQFMCKHITIVPSSLNIILFVCVCVYSNVPFQVLM